MYKSVMLLLFFSTPPLLLPAQVKQLPSVMWQQRLGGASDEAWQSACATADGGIVVCGYTSSNDGDADEEKGNTDAWVARFSDKGDLIWKKRFGGSKPDFANSISAGIGGGYILAGVSYSNDGDIAGNHGYSDAWVLKISEQGEKEWSYLYGGGCFEEAVSVQASFSGGYLIAGGSCSSENLFFGEYKGLYDGWVFHIDNRGMLLWQHHFGGSMNDYFYHLDQNKEGDWILSGETFSQDGDIQLNHGMSDAWLVCISGEGILKWSRSYGGVGNDRFFNVHLDKGGKIIASGYYKKENDFDAWVLKTNEVGNRLHEGFYGAGGTDYFIGAATLEDGGVVFCGSTTIVTDGVAGAEGGGDGWVVKIDSSLQEEWQLIKGGEAADAFVGIAVSGKLIYASGFTLSTANDLPESHGMKDTWLVAMGTDLISSVTGSPFSSDIKIYPNPVTQSGGIFISGMDFRVFSEVSLISAGGVVLRTYKYVRSGQLLPLADLQPGAYWLKIIDTKGKISVSMLIVQ